MIVKIDKKEVEVVKEICALSELKCRFFTIEPNPLLMQVEITERNGDDLSRKDAWLLGRTVAWTLATMIV